MNKVEARGGQHITLLQKLDRLAYGIREESKAAKVRTDRMNCEPVGEPHGKLVGAMHTCK